MLGMNARKSNALGEDVASPWQSAIHDMEESREADVWRLAVAFA